MGARGVAGDVGQRLLGAAVEGQAGVGGERARRALDAQGGVDAEVAPEVLDQRREAVGAGEVVAAQRADRAPRLDQALAGEPAGAFDRLAQRRARPARGRRACARPPAGPPGR